MILLARVWRFLGESWQSVRRARLFYGAVTLAFVGLAVVAAVIGNAAVAVVAGIVALGTAGLTIVAPKLAEATARREERMR
jgi:hypothetical protein